MSLNLITLLNFVEMIESNYLIFFNNHSKISLNFFAVFVSGCKYKNYFYSDNKKMFFLFVFFNP